jgi:iron complex transport system ATP-binding protein
MLLEVHGVRVRLGSSEILEDVTLKVRKAEMIALLGPNGSGKSTLLKTIFGILKPESGVVYLDGKAIAKMGAKDVAKLVGYLPQEGSVTNLSVIDVVLLGRTPYIGVKPSTKDVDMAKRALENVGLKGFEHRIFSSAKWRRKAEGFTCKGFCPANEDAVA